MYLHGPQRGRRGLGHECQHTPVAEAVFRQPREESLDAPAITCRVAGRLEQLQPPRVVSDRAESEEVLQENRPVPATLQVAREESARQDDPDG
jgi:hypothetical protein